MLQSIALYLLENGASINAQNNFHMTPLFSAVEGMQRKISTVSLLLCNEPHSSLVSLIMFIIHLFEIISHKTTGSSLRSVFLCLMLQPQAYETRYITLPDYLVTVNNHRFLFSL